MVEKFNVDNLDHIYDGMIYECCELFYKKLLDYGPTWLYFRYQSLVDQLWIKAKRIRTLEELQYQSKVGEECDSEFIGLMNYAVIMLMKRRMTAETAMPELSSLCMETPETYQRYKEIFVSIFQEIRELMQRKNHDYGNAWLEMHRVSITDQIIVKIVRINTILQHGGQVLVSENIDAQLMDIVNYSMFGLIKYRYQLP